MRVDWTKKESLHKRIAFAILFLASAFLLIVLLFALKPHFEAPNVYTYELGATTKEIKGQDAKTMNINTASKEELMSIQGIGESTAQNIMSYREKHGTIHYIEDLLNIAGIGPKTLDNIRENVSVR